jgi:hypothetical protein
MLQGIAGTTIGLIISAVCQTQQVRVMIKSHLKFTLKT